MSRPRTTASKRYVQQQKREKAQAKLQRRAARRAADSDTNQTAVEAGEPELIAELALLHHAVGADELSLEEFEKRREDIRRQIEQIARLEQ